MSAPMIVKATPAPMVIQNAVQRSCSLISGRCTSAAPSARSENTSTRLEKTSASMARPYSSGTSRRATAIAPAVRMTWRTICAAPAQPRPRETRPCIPPVGAATSDIDHDGTGGCRSAPGRSARVAARLRDYGAGMAISPTARLRGLASDSSTTSISHRMRARRFLMFEQLVALMPRPLSIIDLGGTNEFWEQRAWAGRDDLSITIVNLEAQPRRYDNIHPTVGDATSLAEYADGAFDIAFSNSVIEHLFTFESQAAMAREVQRVASAFWVQTPNFWFPIEPHFLAPGWHWLPEDTRVAILRRRGVGWAGRCPD